MIIILIVNYDSSIFNKFAASLIDNSIVFIYDCHMFIVLATGPMLPLGACNIKLFMVAIVAVS